MAISIPVTSLTAAMLTCFYIFLASLVIRHRRSELISIGDAGEENLARKIRVHANFNEYVPLALLLILLLELSGLPSWVVVAPAVFLLIGRSLHARGLLAIKDRKIPFRFWGMVLTFSSLIWSAATLLITSVKTIIL